MPNCHFIAMRIHRHLSLIHTAMPLMSGLCTAPLLNKGNQHGHNTSRYWPLHWLKFATFCQVLTIAKTTKPQNYPCHVVRWFYSPNSHNSVTLQLSVNWISATIMASFSRFALLISTKVTVGMRAHERKKYKKLCFCPIDSRLSNALCGSPTLLNASLQCCFKQRFQVWGTRLILKS